MVPVAPSGVGGGTLLAESEGEYSDSQNFPKAVHFSPDGLCVLSFAEDAVLRVYEVPAASASAAGGAAHEVCADDWKPCLRSKEAECVYDAAWFPGMDSSEPATCCYVSTSRDSPLHLWDAFSGKLRASYRAYDHSDALVAANCVTFNPLGSRLYGGFERTIRGWDIENPGRECTEYSTCSTRHSADGQRGIISSLAFSIASGGELLAAGSFYPSIWVYDVRAAGPAAELLGKSYMGGVTGLRWGPEGHRLFAGTRADSFIYCWDVRKPDELLRTFPRNSSTNQRIGFDLDTTGRWLFTGTCCGSVLIYDTEASVGQGEEKAVATWAQADAVGGISLSPKANCVAICTGQRRFESVSVSDDDEFEGGCDNDESSPERCNLVRLLGFGLPCTSGSAQS
jgi:WD40 repeat protein